jgi:hypothetical protein
MESSCNKYGQIIKEHNISVKNPGGKRKPGEPWRTWDDSIKMDLT